MIDNIITYDMFEHRHRYAAWFAATAARASPKRRFKVKLGEKLIRKVGLKNICENFDTLPHTEQFNARYHEICG